MATDDDDADDDNDDDHDDDDDNEDDYGRSSPRQTLYGKLLGNRVVFGFSTQRLALALSNPPSQIQQVHKLYDRLLGFVETVDVRFVSLVEPLVKVIIVKMSSSVFQHKD